MRVQAKITGNLSQLMILKRDGGYKDELVSKHIGRILYLDWEINAGQHKKAIERAKAKINMQVLQESGLTLEYIKII